MRSNWIRRFTWIARMGKIFADSALDLTATYRLEAKGLLDRAKLEEMKMRWASRLLKDFHADLTVRGREHLCPDQPRIFVGNHISYLDIPMLMAVAPVVFVAKAELSRWPLLGACMRRVGTVFVERENMQSRAAAAYALGDTIKARQQSIAIFPSGTTTLHEEKPWRLGAFKVAKHHGIEVQPFRLSYDPLRPAAYIDDDVLLPHMTKLLMGRSLKASIEFHPAVMIDDISHDSHRILQWVKREHL